jgi:histidinol-phosphatase (PHP family)
MRYSCIHTHTNFCDGTDDIETCCRRAVEKGLVSLGFSAHGPIAKKTGLPGLWHLSEDRVLEYCDAVRAAKKRWEGRLPVYLGLEVDFFPGLMGPADRDFQELGLDYLIGSVHYVIPPRGAPFSVDDSAETVDKGIREGYAGDALGMVEAYWDSLLSMIRAGGFDLLGHPDLVRKNNARGRLFSEESGLYREKSAAAVALLSKTGLPGEVNTGGMNRGKTEDCYPRAALLALFRKHGIPMTINADAHKAEDLDGHYGDACKALLAAGYTEAFLFEGRRNGKACWTPENLT